MARSVSFRLSLLGNLSAMLVLLGGAVLATTFVAGQQTLRLLSRGYISRTLDDAEAAVGLFLFPVINTVKVARAWGESGLLDSSEPEQLNRVFGPILGAFPQIAAAFVADERGREYLLSRSRRVEAHLVQFRNRNVCNMLCSNFP